ncbi:MAG: hypothetical protein ACOYN0_01250 [Phycisphaerales bacterium]
MKPLITTVMDLNAALGGRAELPLGGGLGLYLKQEHLRATGARTLLSLDRLPPARTTQDVDLFLRAEVIASKEEVSRYRAALDKLGFVVVPGSQWLKFTRSIGGTDVLLDVMVGPLGEHANTVRLKDSRARPKGLGGKSGLHAFATEEALGIERGPLRIPLAAADSDGNNATCEVLIPRAFPYALMKLGALRDRVNDESKQEGRHHAMDLYRIVGLLTEEEVEGAATLARGYAGHAEVGEAIRTIDTLLAPANGLGRVRLLEYQRANRASTPEVDPEFLVRELRRLLLPPLGESQPS